MWHNLRTGECAYQPDMDDKELAEMKLVPEENIDRLRRMGKERIGNIMVLYKYMDYLVERGLHVHFRNNPRRSILRTLVHYPFNLPEFSWTIPMLAAAVKPSNYARFIEDNDAPEIELNDLLGVRLKRLRRMVKEAKSLYIKRKERNG